ncbi:hypothetical protein [Marinobacter sp. F4216]|uniref:hypothetical protein n=1 Tax=Marinobacter sp. F4216 TaxID=2874281 RepID=UPI001CBAB19E|nr:hypothetical protein [Marinobacter sp. F4216]MBZ2167461.1 hypothetical protein [Marinobacter sp. F4216]
MKRIMNVLLLASVVNGLAACSAFREPTYGEQIEDEGLALREVGAQWSKGESLVEKGEERIRSGQERIREGERMIEEGREMTREGTQLMRDSKLRYEQGGGDSAY